MDIPAQVRPLFDQLAAKYPASGLAFCIATKEGHLADWTAGTADKEGTRPWQSNTLVPIWSTTKGPASATMLCILDQNGLDLQTRVRSVWPDLKADINFAQLMSHQAGLPALDAEASVLNHDLVVGILEKQEPLWPPGSRHGYHPRTFGFLLDECALRIQGQRIGEVWEKEIAGPLGLDAWIGLPESELPRLAQVFAGRSASRPEEKEFVAAYMQEQSPTRRAFDGLKGLNAIFEFNHAQARTAASPAFGGFASACGLAKFYAVLAGGGAHIFSSRLISWLSERLVDGYDEILRTTTAFTAGMQMDPRDGSRQIFGGPVKNFGHPGAGGSIAFADPERGWGVGLVLNQLEPGIFPNQAIRELMASIYF